MVDEHDCLDQWLEPSDKHGLRMQQVKAFPEAGYVHRCQCGRVWEMACEFGVGHWRRMYGDRANEASTPT